MPDANQPPPEPDPAPVAAPTATQAPKRGPSRRLTLILGVAVAAFLGVVLVAQMVGAPGEQASARDRPEYVRNLPGDPLALGDIDAPVVLVEWIDMRCPYCAVVTRDTMPLIIAEYVETGKVRLEVNDVSFFGEDSTVAAVAVRAAGEQGRYFEYLRALYDDAPENGHPDMPREKLLGFAETAGVPDLGRFERDLDSPELRAAVEASTANAHRLGVSSVPFFVADGTAIAGAQQPEMFRQLLDEALERAQP